MSIDAEWARVRGRLLGLIDERDIRRVDLPRPAPKTIAGLLGLSDLTSTISDALDELGLGAVVGASTLAPRTATARICGPAVTVRYVREGGTAGALAARGERPRLADRDLYAVARPGDVAVFDCAAADASVMGGLSARWARRLEIAGCVVDGAVRDLDSIRGVGVPVWSRAVTPRTGKHRMQAVEINGRVALDGAPVEPGDVIAADASGVCVIPAACVEAVLARCREAEAGERALREAIDGGAPPDVVRAIHPPERW